MFKRLFLTMCLVLGASSAFAASADLSWNANTEGDLAGYRLYRGNATGAGSCPVGPLQPVMTPSGQPVSVPQGPGTVITYTDASVPVFDGVLCYEVTAFDTSGNESAHSVRATKTVNLVPPLVPSNLLINAVR